MMRIAIIEDEPVTARNLARMLQDADDSVQVLSVLTSVKESVQWLINNQPACDLLFMDIRLSDGLSFNIFEKIQVTVPVIFVTAYEEHALKAFKSNAIDYILKPFDETDVDKALQKYKMLKGETKTQLPHIKPEILLQLLQDLNQKQSRKQSFLVHYRDRLIPVAAEEIFFFHSENEIVQATVAGNKQYIIEGTLEKLQQELDPYIFFRANRQFIINRKAVTEVHFYFNGRLLLKLNPEAKEQVLISKAKVPEFREWMNK